MNRNVTHRLEPSSNFVLQKFLSTKCNHILHSQYYSTSTSPRINMYTELLLYIHESTISLIPSLSCISIFPSVTCTPSALWPRATQSRLPGCGSPFISAEAHVVRAVFSYKLQKCSIHELEKCDLFNLQSVSTFQTGKVYRQLYHFLPLRKSWGSSSLH